MLSHEAIWSALDRLAESHRLTPSGLARRSGLDPTAFNKSKRLGADGRLRWPSTESISKVLDATGTSAEVFFGSFAGGRELRGAGELPGGDFPPQVSTIPLIGFAKAGAGGFFDDGGFPLGHGWDLVEFPVEANRRQRVYALEVQGDSMLPLYRDGDVLVVDPGASLRRGDRVVLKTREGEVMAKLLARQTATSVDLVSLNPEHADRSFELADVEWIARIIWASQ